MLYSHACTGAMWRTAIVVHVRYSTWFQAHKLLLWDQNLIFTPRSDWEDALCVGGFSLFLFFFFTALSFACYTLEGLRSSSKVKPPENQSSAHDDKITLLQCFHLGSRQRADGEKVRSFHSATSALWWNEAWSALWSQWIIPIPGYKYGLSPAPNPSLSLSCLKLGICARLRVALSWVCHCRHTAALVFFLTLWMNQKSHLGPGEDWCDSLRQFTDSSPVSAVV